MNIKDLKTLILEFFKTIGLLFIYIVLGLFFDSTYFNSIFEKGQHITTLLALIIFIIMFSRSTKRIKELMFYGVIIAAICEPFFSLFLDMYTYRLGNVPLYLAIGHTIVYRATFKFCRKSMVRKYSIVLEKYFTIFILVYSTLFLIFAQDIFGFVLSILVVLLLQQHPKERLFFFSMYIVVAFLEIIGTNYGCWFWPKTAFGVIPFLKSANPPSGISFFYFILTLGCFWFYKKRNSITWKRLEAIRLFTKN